MRNPAKNGRRFISRRGFMRRVAALAPTIIPASALGANGAVAPSNRVTLGFIGTGSHGVGMNLRSFLPNADAQVVALCDVDRGRVQSAREVVAAQYAPERSPGVVHGLRHHAGLARDRRPGRPGCRGGLDA